MGKSPDAEVDSKDAQSSHHPEAYEDFVKSEESGAAFEDCGENWSKECGKEVNDVNYSKDIHHDD